MGNKQTGYFVYNSAVEGPDFNYHQDYNQGPYNHEGMCKTNPTIIQRLEYSPNVMIRLGFLPLNLLLVNQWDWQRGHWSA